MIKRAGEQATGDTGEIFTFRRMTVADWSTYVDEQIDAYTDGAPATLRCPAFTCDTAKVSA